MTTTIPESDWAHGEDVLRTWLRRARESQRSHYRSANFYQNLEWALGVPAIALSAVVGTATFVSLQHEATFAWKIAAGLLSILAGGLMAIHTAMRFSDRVERHKVAGARYAAVRRQIEEILATPIQNRGEVRKAMSEVRQRMDKFAEDSPALPPRYWDEGTSYNPPSFLQISEQSDSKN
jgi:hypothetical protein